MTKEHLFEVLTRVGFAARGLLYLAICALVIVLGEAGGADAALKLLSAGAGRWILVVIAAGFAGYGLWRLADAAFGTEHPGDGHRALGQRVGAGVSGAVHVFLAFQTAKLAFGAVQAASDPDGTAQTVLSLPAGGLLLGAVGVGVGIAAAVQFGRAASCSFLQHLVPEAREGFIKWLGRLGYLARGAVFLVAAYFLVDAALAGASSRAGGTEQVFSWLSEPMARGLAAGLGLFGIYSLTEAWYRRIRTPDFDSLG